MDCRVPGHDSIRAQKRDTHSDVHHQQRRHALDELGHEVGYGILFFPRRRRTIVVRCLHDVSFVSRNEDLLRGSPGGVSDHISWHRIGVPVMCATEANPVRTPQPLHLYC